MTNTNGHKNGHPVFFKLGILFGLEYSVYLDIHLAVSSQDIFRIDDQGICGMGSVISSDVSGSWKLL